MPRWQSTSLEGRVVGLYPMPETLRLSCSRLDQMFRNMARRRRVHTGGLDGGLSPRQTRALIGITESSDNGGGFLSRKCQENLGNFSCGSMVAVINRVSSHRLAQLLEQTVKVRLSLRCQMAVLTPRSRRWHILNDRERQRRVPVSGSEFQCWPL